MYAPIVHFQGRAIIYTACVLHFTDIMTVIQVQENPVSATQVRQHLCCNST